MEDRKLSLVECDYAELERRVLASMDNEQLAEAVAAAKSRRNHAWRMAAYGLSFSPKA